MSPLCSTSTMFQSNSSNSCAHKRRTSEERLLMLNIIISNLLKKLRTTARNAVRSESQSGVHGIKRSLFSLKTLSRIYLTITHLWFRH